MSMPTHERLRFWRQARSLTQQELASRVQVAQSWIATLEKGLFPIREPLLSALAEALHVPVVCFLPQSPDPLRVTEEAYTMICALQPVDAVA